MPPDGPQPSRWCGRWHPILGGVFGQAVTDPDDLDPHFHSYFSAMPIRDLLEFAAPAGGPEPEARLRELSGSLRDDDVGRTDRFARVRRHPERLIGWRDPSRSRGSRWQSSCTNLPGTAAMPS